MMEFDRKYQQLVLWAFVALVLVVASLMLAPFLPALVWATVLSVLARPWYARLSLKMNANAAAALTTIGVLFLVGIPIAIVGTAVFFQVNGFVREIQGSAPVGQNPFDLAYLAGEMDKSIGPMIQKISPSFTFSHWFEQNRDTFLQSVRAPLSKFLVGAGTGAFTMVVAFLTMFFMLRDGHRLRGPTITLVPLPKERTEEILDKLGRTIQAVFVSVVLVGIAQGLLAGIGYWVAGVPNALMWTVATLVLCMIPLLGAPILYIPLSLILIAQGRVGAGIGLLAYCLIVVSNIDNLLKPWIIGSKIELHPMAVFFALLGGLFLFGPVGLMAGPMMLTLLLAVFDVMNERRQLAMNGGDAPNEV